MMEQLSLYKEQGPHLAIPAREHYRVQTFSAGHFFRETARQNLERRYESILEVTDQFARRSVSYQFSKNDCLHNWLKYKEGFSADLVNTLLDEMGAVPGDTILDPFLGSGTTALVCQSRGIHSIGYDVLPLTSVSIAAKAGVWDFDIQESAGQEHTRTAHSSLSNRNRSRRRTRAFYRRAR